MCLPSDYESTRNASGNYMRIQDGENRIRILCQPIFGWEDWTSEGKPVRFHDSNKPKRPIVEAKPIKRFWSMIVWNYDEEKIQILTTTKAGFIHDLEDLFRDTDWGPLNTYDIKLVKTGKEKLTRYNAKPIAKRPIPSEVIAAFKDRPIWLDALYTQEDPFANHWKSYTPGLFDEGKSKASNKVISIGSPKISDTQADELEKILSECDHLYQDVVWDTLRKEPYNCNTLVDLPSSAYQQLKSAALKKRDEHLLSKMPNDDLPF